MIIHDVNVLVYAYREDADDHDRYRESFDGVVYSERAFGFVGSVLASFVRIVTHPRIFEVPTPLVDAFEFTKSVAGQPNAVEIAPGPRHWDIFSDLCLDVGAFGNLVTDAFIAALAIESGSTLLSADGDFAKFDGLDWRHPLG